jgi:hypothetical protein
VCDDALCVWDVSFFLFFFVSIRNRTTRVHLCSTTENNALIQLIRKLRRTMSKEYEQLDMKALAKKVYCVSIDAINYQFPFQLCQSESEWNRERKRERERGQWVNFYARFVGVEKRRVIKGILYIIVSRLSNPLLQSDNEMTQLAIRGNISRVNEFSCHKNWHICLGGQMIVSECRYSHNSRSNSKQNTHTRCLTHFSAAVKGVIYFRSFPCARFSLNNIY